MFSVDGKFYRILTNMMLLFSVNFLFTLASWPLITLPVTLLYLCHLVLNIYQHKKLFAKLRLTRKIWKKALPTFAITLLSLVSVYLLLINKVNFIGLFIIATLLAFNICIYLLLLLFDMKLMQLYRMAFFYMLAYFYKTIVLCIGLLFVAFIAVHFFTWIIIVILFSGYLYLFVWLNFNTLMNSFGQKNKGSKD